MDQTPIVLNYPPSYPIRGWHPYTTAQARAALTLIAHTMTTDLRSCPPFPGDRFITFPTILLSRFHIQLSWDRVYFYVYDMGVGDVLKLSTASLAVEMGKGTARKLASFRRIQFLNCTLKDTMVRANAKAFLERCLNHPSGEQKQRLQHVCPENTTWKAVDIDDTHHIGVQAVVSADEFVTVKVTRAELLDEGFDVVAKVADELLFKHMIRESLHRFAPRREIDGDVATQWKLQDAGDTVIWITESSHGLKFQLERRMFLDPLFSAGQWLSNELIRSYCHPTCVLQSQPLLFRQSATYTEFLSMSSIT